MKILLILALFSIAGLFIPAWAQNLPKTQTYEDAMMAENQCKKAIEQDSSLTEAERLVAKRACEKEAAKKIVGDIEVKKIRLKELRMEKLNQCESWYEHYQSTTEENFMVQKPQQLVNDCIVLYNDEIWEYSGEDRLEKLFEKADGLYLFEIVKAEAKNPEESLPPKQLQAAIDSKIESMKSGIQTAEDSLRNAHFESVDAQSELDKAWTALWWAKKYLGDAEGTQTEGEQLISQSRFKEAGDKYHDSNTRAEMVNSNLFAITELTENAQSLESNYQSLKKSESTQSQFCFLFWCW